jgi:nucleoside phosphorylase
VLPSNLSIKLLHSLFLIFRLRVVVIEQSDTMKELSRNDYTVGWISSIPIEMAAAQTVLDEEHKQLPLLEYEQSIYVLGEIHSHNVAIVCLPLGSQGHTSAAHVARDMQSAFPQIKSWLLVGIGGGVPTETNDMQLGDVVVSKPTDEYGGVIQYDLGKTIQHGAFQRTGALNKPSGLLRSAVTSLSAVHILDTRGIPQIIAKAQTENPVFVFPGRRNDQLFENDYIHPKDATTCRSCDQGRLRTRKARQTDDPKIYYGLIATGNQVMRDAVRRDRLAQELNILCFEMEAAGLMDRFSCLVVRGISDYADSHKNEDWQPYAAVTAAAYAKELLSTITPAQSNVSGLRDQAQSTLGAHALDQGLQERALMNGYDDYKNSITDLLKLLDLDYSPKARMRYADILRVQVGPPGSAKQNTALHRAIMQQYSKSGSELLHMLKSS